MLRSNILHDIIIAESFSNVTLLILSDKMNHEFTKYVTKNIRSIILVFPLTMAICVIKYFHKNIIKG